MSPAIVLLEPVTQFDETDGVQYEPGLPVIGPNMSLVACAAQVSGTGYIVFNAPTLSE